MKYENLTQKNGFLGAKHGPRIDVGFKTKFGLIWGRTNRRERREKGRRRRRGRGRGEEEKPSKKVWKLILSMDFVWNCMDHMDFMYRYMFAGCGLYGNQTLE